ncbi:MAG: NADP-dependent oxidoreductase [Patescibacteria group bacterium]
MKAIQIDEYGGVDVLKVREAAEPVAQRGQVLVAVQVASLNPVDCKIRAGFFREMVPLEFPATLGGDFAGRVIETGEEVYGSAIVLNGGSGAFAQKAAANTKNISPKPKSVDFVGASALPLVGSSAIQALEEHINLQKGQKILIHGGAGGIGHLAIQLARAIGAYVATTVAAEDIDYVKEIGADEVIDYKSQDFSEILKDFDAVFDTVGGEVSDKSFKVLKKGGVLVSMLGQPNEEEAKKYGVAGIGQNTQTNTEHLKRLAQLVDEKKIKVNVDKQFTLDQAKEAFTYQEEVRPRGKVVLQI